MFSSLKEMNEEEEHVQVHLGRVTIPSSGSAPIRGNAKTSWGTWAIHPETISAGLVFGATKTLKTEI